MVPAFWVQRRAFFLLWNSERMDQATARISRDNPTVNRELQANVITKERERERKKNLSLCKTQIKKVAYFSIDKCKCNLIDNYSLSQRSKSNFN